MSLARLAVRICTTQALSVGAETTLAQDRVRDSSIVDLEVAISKAPKPIVLVYTDNSEFVPDAKEVWGGQGSTTLVLILAVASATKLKDGTVEFTFPHTDPAIELSLDIMERQIQAALMEPANAWARCWRGLVTKVSKWSSRRGSSAKEGARFGARQILVELETVNDPVPGHGPVEGTWADFMALVEDPGTGADVRALGPPLRALLEGTPVPSWVFTMRELGINRPTLKGIGLEPLVFHADDDDEAALLQQVTVFPGGVTSDSEAMDDGYVPPEMG